MPASTTPQMDLAGFQTKVQIIAGDARPGTLGVGLMNLENGESYLFNDDRPFPMQSVSKLLLGAAVLSEVDAGRLSLDEAFRLEENQMSPQHSPIATAWPARREYSTQELLESCVVGSDNTATDVLMKRIGGPGAVTAWLTSKALAGLRVDRYERELQPAADGMATFRPAWRAAAVYGAVRSKIPATQRLAAMRAYMADPRDTGTPRGMLEFLQKLHREELASTASTGRLLDMMTRTVSAPDRLRAGLPPEAVLAHRAGSSGFHLGLRPACNDVGIFTLGDGRAYAIVAFLSGTTLEDGASEALVARVASAAVKAIR